MPTAIAALALIGALAAAVFAVRRRARRGIATPMQRATYDVLHTAGLATEPLRAGLDHATAAKAVRHLRNMVGATGLALLTREEVLALDGDGQHHREQLIAAADKSVHTGRSAILGLDELPCDRIDCGIRGAVIVPLSGADAAVAAVTDQSPAPGLVQATLETAHWVSTQLAWHELDSSRARLAEAELKALRAQISRISSTTRSARSRPSCAPILSGPAN
jgi:two-component system LytT family sensor kinase